MWFYYNFLFGIYFFWNNIKYTHVLISHNLGIYLFLVVHSERTCSAMQTSNWKYWIDSNVNFCGWQWLLVPLGGAAGQCWWWRGCSRWRHCYHLSSHTLLSVTASFVQGIPLLASLSKDMVTYVNDDYMLLAKVKKNRCSVSVSVFVEKRFFNKVKQRKRRLKSWKWRWRSTQLYVTLAMVVCSGVGWWMTRRWWSW